MSDPLAECVLESWFPAIASGWGSERVGVTFFPQVGYASGVSYLYRSVGWYIAVLSNVYNSHFIGSRDVVTSAYGFVSVMMRPNSMVFPQGESYLCSQRCHSECRIVVSDEFMEVDYECLR